MDPFFLDSPAGRLFAVYHPPRSGLEPRVLVVHCPAFAEEMNKSRRMVALQARAWSDRDIGTLVVDLFGTGDSAGDFGDATWDAWEADVDAALQWARTRCHRVWLWGHRGGALLAAAVAARESRAVSSSGRDRNPDRASDGTVVERLVLWQPVLRGEAWLTQFLRLRTAAALLRGLARETIRDLQARLRGGEAVEVAGYSLAPRLAARLAEQDLGELLRQVACPVTWLEVSALPDGGPSPASARVCEALQTAGVLVDMRAVPGESFWATQDIATAPALLSAAPQA